MKSRDGDTTGREPRPLTLEISSGCPGMNAEALRNTGEGRLRGLPGHRTRDATLPHPSPILTSRPPTARLQAAKAAFPALRKASPFTAGQPERTSATAFQRPHSHVRGTGQPPQPIWPHATLSLMDHAEERKPTIQRMRAMFLEGKRPIEIIDYLLDETIVDSIIICILFFRHAFFLDIRDAGVIGASRRFEARCSDTAIDQELTDAILRNKHKWDPPSE
jgi:hypothetical protein